MLRKRFHVKINLKLQAITCPGVWLCTHGYLEATIKTLGYFFRTGAMEPRFPLLCHDNFSMEGYFRCAATVADLEQMLAAEQIEITLWQNGRRLAYFVGKLADVMQHAYVPEQPNVAAIDDYNVQLLMKATTAFPGIIAPKIELQASVCIKDRLQQQLHSEHCGSWASSVKTFQMPATIMPIGVREHTTGSMPSESPGSCCGCSTPSPTENASPAISTKNHRRHQKPVCHAKMPKSNPKSRSIMPSTMKTFDQHNRRFSNCSSNTLMTLQSLDSSNQRSQSSHSCHRADDHYPSFSLSALATCQNFCEICQNYRQVFS